MYLRRWISWESGVWTEKKMAVSNNSSSGHDKTNGITHDFELLIDITGHDVQHRKKLLNLNNFFSHSNEIKKKLNERLNKLIY